MAKLSEIFDLQMGKTPARANSDYWNDGTNNWVSIADLSGYGKYVEDTKEQITDKGVHESGIKAVPPNTVIMSFKLSLGKTAITREAVYTNEAIMAFIPKNTCEILPDYLFYMLSNIDWSKGTNRAVMGATLNKATIGEINVDIPPLDRQIYVATVLDKISSLISLRKQQLAKLDELVKARFVEMFGDPATNPHNWEQVPLKTSAIRLSDGPFGSNLKSEHYVQSGIRVIRLGNIGVGKFIDEDKSFISKEHYEQLKKYTCKPGEIVIGTLGDPNLRACIVPEYLGIAINKADCVHYIPKNNMLVADFVCQYINCPETLLLASSMVHGQTRSRISSGQLADLPIFVPPIELQNEFALFCQVSNRQKLTIQQSLDKLEVLKKSLMQEYFEGGKDHG